MGEEVKQLGTESELKRRCRNKEQGGENENGSKNRGVQKNRLSNKERGTDGPRQAGRVVGLRKGDAKEKT